jgi:hypothetical protein
MRRAPQLGQKPRRSPKGPTVGATEGNQMLRMTGPPGIAKQYLPNDLRHALPAPHDGYERLIVDGKILLAEIATGVIHDILMDAVFH